MNDAFLDTFVEKIRSSLGNIDFNVLKVPSVNETQPLTLFYSVFLDLQVRISQVTKKQNLDNKLKLVKSTLLVFQSLDMIMFEIPALTFSLHRYRKAIKEHGPLQVLSIVQRKSELRFQYFLDTLQRVCGVLIRRCEKVGTFCLYEDLTEELKKYKSALDSLIQEFFVLEEPRIRAREEELKIQKKQVQALVSIIERCINLEIFVLEDVEIADSILFIVLPRHFIYHQAEVAVQERLKPNQLDIQNQIHLEMGRAILALSREAKNQLLRKLGGKEESIEYEDEVHAIFVQICELGDRSLRGQVDFKTLIKAALSQFLHNQSISANQTGQF